MSPAIYSDARQVTLKIAAIIFLLFSVTLSAQQPAPAKQPEPPTDDRPAEPGDGRGAVRSDAGQPAGAVSEEARNGQPVPQP